MELSKTLPSTNGLLTFLTGGTDLSTFGNDLTIFGEDLSAYASAIASVQPEAVAASANAAQALSNLATGLPDSSLFDKWFGGDQTLASFGNEISKFGASMQDYYNEISGIDIGQMSSVVAQVWNLLALAEGVNDLNTSGLTNFANSMKKMGDAGVSGFADAFRNCGDTINDAVNSMLSTVSVSIAANASTVNSAMGTLVDAMAEIVDGKVIVIQRAMGDTVNSVNDTTGTTTIIVKVAVGANYLAGADKQVSVNAQFVTIYGVEWDWTSGGPTKGKRTDGATLFGDPNPAVNNGSGSSPFDNLYPWKDMTKVTRTGGVMVKEPK